MTGQRWLPPLDATIRLSRAQLRAYQAALVERELTARARLTTSTTPARRRGLSVPPARMNRRTVQCPRT